MTDPTVTDLSRLMQKSTSFFSQMAQIAPETLLPVEGIDDKIAGWGSLLGRF